MNKITSLLSLGMILLISTTHLFGQEIVFDPSALVPHDEGYYILGVYVDENQDGVPEFHNQCDDYYEDDVSDGIYDPQKNHVETGEQQGFKYFTSMIMPTCIAKDTIDPPISMGFIQIAACYNSGTDSASLSYIQTPAIRNLQSMYLETSCDVSINDNRKIPFFIEYSLDYGSTWEAAYILDLVLSKGGSRHSYDGSVYLEFGDMKTASESKNIVIRIITNDRAADRPYTGQYVNVHRLSLVADLATNTKEYLLEDDRGFNVSGKTISSISGALSVFDLSGRIIGTSETITVPRTGIFLVKNNKNVFHKVLINYE